MELHNTILKIYSKSKTAFVKYVKYLQNEDYTLTTIIKTEGFADYYARLAITRLDGTRNTAKMLLNISNCINL